MKKNIYLVPFCILIMIVMLPFALTFISISDLFQKLLIFILSLPFGIYLAQYYNLICKAIAGTILNLKPIVSYLYPRLWFNGKQKKCFILDEVLCLTPPIFYSIPNKKSRPFFILYFIFFFSIWTLIAILLFWLSNYFALTFLTWPIVLLILNDYYKTEGLDSYYRKCLILDEVISGKEINLINHYNLKNDNDFISTCYLILLKNSENIFTIDMIRDFNVHEQMNILFLLLQKTSKNISAEQNDYYNELINLVRGRPSEAILVRDAKLVLAGNKKANVSLRLGIVRELLDLIE